MKAEMSETEKQPEVTLKGASIAVIAMGDGCSKMVVFRPTRATLNAVQKFEGEEIDLSIEDANGLFSPRQAQRIVGHIYERGNDTMIVDTINQSIDYTEIA